MTEELFWKYMKYGGGEKFGEPCTPERVEQNGQGQIVFYRDFQRGAIYWTSETGVSVVVDEKILKYWRDIDPAGRDYGYPTSDPIQDRGRVYNRFQRGTIYYSPYLDTCEAYRDGKSSQDFRRRVSILIVAIIWFIGILFIGVSSGGGIFKGFLAVITLLLGPLTALLFYLLWEQPDTHDRS